MSSSDFDDVPEFILDDTNIVAWKSLHEKKRLAFHAKQILDKEEEGILVKAIRNIISSGKWAVRFREDWDDFILVPVDYEARKALSLISRYALGIDWHSCYTIQCGDVSLVSEVNDNHFNFIVYLDRDKYENPTLTIDIDVREFIRAKVKDQLHSLKVEHRELKEKIRGLKKVLKSI